MMRAIFLALFALPLYAAGSNDPTGGNDPAEVFPRIQTVDFNSSMQQLLSEGELWQTFKSNHPSWNAAFNQMNNLPHRAYGTAIPVSGNSLEEKTQNFISNELSWFEIPMNELVLTSTPTTSKHQYANYKQYFQGIEVVNSRLMVKYHELGVVAFGCDVYNNLDLQVTPTIGENQAIGAAMEGINIEILDAELAPELKILVLPEAGQTAHLCYTVCVNAVQDNAVPAKYKCLVDAHSGALISRIDEVKTINNCPKCKESKKVKAMGMPDVDLHVSAEIYETSLINPATTVGLPNLEVSINGETFFTDENGDLSIVQVGPLGANFTLQGLWSQVNTDGTVPAFGMQVPDGSTEVSFDGDANIKELSAYNSVNAIHDHMKAWLPSFTGLDFAMPTNIDVEGTCNAFYDGEINFYDAGGGCNATSLVADVVYHEYGHGINNVYYADNGMDFANGAMHEGYADFWAISLTENPQLGQGFFDDTDEGLRRYDINPKVYPQDLVGQVHADGEIICGAWYDTHLLMGGNWDNTMQLFVDTYAGFQAEGMNGDEGAVFFDVLMDALQADDDNGDLEDGTPNDLAIIEGFAIHGIYLLAGADIEHENVLTTTSTDDVLIEADVLIQFPFGIYLQEVNLYHKINGATEWSISPMTNTEGDTYQANLGPQEAGTIVAYYIGLIDTYDNLTRVDPIGADGIDPTLPHFTIIGMEKVLEHDGDTAEDFGDWQTGGPNDLATAGVWELNIPIGSFGFPGDPSTIASPNFDHTGGEFAFITEQASDPNGSIYDTDVDDGGTTLRSQVIDLTSFTEPVFSYWRWLTHSPVGDPNFAWSVDISDDGGNTWVSLEKTVTQDRQYRRNVFRVSDYVEVTDQFQIRFIADDPIFVGSGALVEAALDDIFLWDAITTDIADVEVNQFSLFPNPALDQVTLFSTGKTKDQQTVQMFDSQGRMVLNEAMAGSGKIILDISNLTPGIYSVVLQTEESRISRPLIVQ